MQDIVHAISTVLQVRVADLVKDESLATYPVYLTHKGGVYTAILRGGKPFDIGDQRVKDWQFSGVSQTDSRYSVWALFPRF